MPAPDWLLIAIIAKAVWAHVIALAPIAIALTVATVAIGQWKVAQDKLSLDLFDRRFRAWNSMTLAFERCLEVAESNGPEEVDYLKYKPLLDSFARSKDEGYFLFGDEVRALWVKLENLMMIAPWAHTDEKGIRSTIDLKVGYTIWAKQLTDLRDEMRLAVEPYMMLGRIGVNRPARAKRAKNRKF